MPLLKEEARDDENYHDNARMPDIIHLGPAFQVNSVANEKPLIIEDMTGYEVIRGRFQIFVGREEAMPDSLIRGERIEPSFEPHKKRMHREGTETLSPLVNKNNNEKTEVAQAFSLLRSSSNMSDITFEEKDEINKNEFERERLAL